MGWAVSSDTATVVTNFPVTNDTDFVAVWGPGYNVYYHANGGTYPGGAPDNQTMYGAEYGSNGLIAPPANPSKLGFFFLGWAERSDSATVISAYPVTRNLDIDAVWSPPYTVNFYVNGGTYPGNAADPQTAPEVPLGWRPLDHKPGNPTKAHSDFLGWALTGETTISSSYAVTGNTDLHAVWRLKSAYTFSYSAGSGGSITGTATQTVYESESGTAVTANPNSGYRFVKWSDNSTSNQRIDINATGNLTFSATFELIPPPPGGGGGGGGTPPEKQKVDPEINWNPANINEGESIGAPQLNAVFSVSGTSVYSPAAGFKPEVGPLSIGITFTPNNAADYNSISATRTIEVIKKVAPTPKPSPSATPSATPTPKPSPSATPSVSPSPMPKPSPSPTKRPTAVRRPAKKVVTLSPTPTVTPPTIGVGNKDLVVQGLNQGQHIRVKISDLQGKSAVVAPESTTAKSTTNKKKSKSAVSIDITPTLDSTLKKGAQIAVGGAKKNQRVRVSVK
jgi:hypothetical protein